MYANGVYPINQGHEDESTHSHPAAYPEDAYPLSFFQRSVGFHLAARKYQFVTRSGSGPKFWVFKARSPRMNVGFFNRYKPQVCRANLNVRIGGMESRPQRHLAHMS
jgi:hypothetical protein